MNPGKANKIVISVFLLIALAYLAATIAYEKNLNKFNAKNLAKETYDSCSYKNRPKGQDIYLCYNKKFMELSLVHGQKNAFLILSNLQGIDRRARSCHFIAHGIGWGAYKKNPQNALLEIQQADTQCTYGAQMGIVELYVSELPKGKLTAEHMREICGTNPPGNCNHGLGHLVLLETKGSINEALDMCDSIETQKQVELCYRGVFMEHIMGFNLADHGLVPDTIKQSSTRAQRLPEIEILCFSQNGERADACWFEISHSAYEFFKGNITEVTNYCKKAHTDRGKKECTLHAIANAFTEDNFDYKYYGAICRTLGEYEEECYLTLVSNSVGTTPFTINRTILFCDSIPEFKEKCISQIKRSTYRTADQETEVI